MNNDLFHSTLEIVEMTLNRAKIDKSSIHEILLIGGSTRIPKIRKCLQDFFNGKQLNQSINPDEAVAYGAAIQAAILTRNESEKVKDLLLLDVAPFSLVNSFYESFLSIFYMIFFQGIETAGGKIIGLTKRNMRIPGKQTKIFTIAPSYQSDKIVVELTEFDDKNPIKQTEAIKAFLKKQFNIDIKVFEGEDELAEGNSILGYFTLKDILLSSNNIPRIEITFDIDAYGILNLSAIDKTSKKENKITVTNDKGRLSKLDTDNIIKNLDKYDREYEE